VSGGKSGKKDLEIHPHNLHSEIQVESAAWSVDRDQSKGSEEPHNRTDCTLRCGDICPIGVQNMSGKRKGLGVSFEKGSLEELA
jgi:hypothetical protein